jgi:hypothetical protein
MAGLRFATLVLLVPAAIGCARRAAAPTRSEPDVQQCIQDCHADQQDNPEETPYDCRAVCEGGDMGSRSSEP